MNQCTAKSQLSRTTPSQSVSRDFRDNLRPTTTVGLSDDSITILRTGKHYSGSVGVLGPLAGHDAARNGLRTDIHYRSGQAAPIPSASSGRLDRRCHHPGTVSGIRSCRIRSRIASGCGLVQYARDAFAQHLAVRFFGANRHLSESLEVLRMTRQELKSLERSSPGSRAVMWSCQPAPASTENPDGCASSSSARIDVNLCAVKFQIHQRTGPELISPARSTQQVDRQ